MSVPSSVPARIIVPCALLIRVFVLITFLKLYNPPNPNASLGVSSGDIM